MKRILINATASTSSGALSILRSFINYIKKNENDLKDNFHFILFTQLDEFTSCSVLSIEKVKVSGWKERIKWDFGGLKKYCDSHFIEADLIISMQNTCTKWKGILQLVYYHQSLPFFSYRWNLLKKEEFKLFLYAHFYKYFVNINNENAEYVVQLEWIKDAFCRKFRNINENKVHVITPDKPRINVGNINSEIICKKLNICKEERKIFLYPATPMRYKNHEIIIKALSHITSRERESIRVLFTVSKNSFVNDLIQKYKVADCCECIGSIPYEELLGLYKVSNALLFPSTIETYGLPLIEASCFGLPIFVSDLPYAHEVLKEYNNCVFLNDKDLYKWREIFYMPLHIRENEIPKTNFSSWGLFLDQVKELVLRGKIIEN